MKGVRFAPSPTGLFHVGNLRTAWVSHQISKILNEPWVVRIEDIDTARARSEFRDHQLRDLETLGLVADEVIVQSERSKFHFELFEQARREGRVYPCDCSRNDVLESLRRVREAPHGPTPDYSGHCRNRAWPADLTTYAPTETLAWRWRHSDSTGHHDAIVARTGRDGTAFSAGYHWACASDDAAGGYRVLVRAWDLAPAEKVQKEIRRWQGCTETTVFHTALVLQSNGHRLEKRTRGVTLGELQQNGLSLNTLIDAFTRSFDQKQVAETLTRSTGGTRDDVGESQRQITVVELGLSF